MYKKRPSITQATISIYEFERNGLYLQFSNKAGIIYNPNTINTDYSLERNLTAGSSSIFK